MELTDRKKQILKIVVESYINTAEPVGSKAIADQLPEKVSSATVRKDLADLSDMGYLEQPQYIKDPYRRFLENKIREEWDFSGVPIQIYFRQK